MRSGEVMNDVSDTARWVAHYRALESARADALFRDPLAGRLAGEKGRRMAERMAKLALPWAIAVRTRVYDELLLDAIEQDGADAVVNLAAGMDARPYRLRLPSALRWIELDLPQIMEEKRALLAGENASCAVEHVGLDLADRRALRAQLERIASRFSSVVVVTEGLLAYLDEGTVSALAKELFACSPIRSWVLEAALPEVLARNERAWGKQFERAGARMKFAPLSGIPWFCDFGWKVRTERSCLLEARRLGREPRFARLLHFMKGLTPGGREWLRKVVVYGVLERGAS